MSENSGPGPIRIRGFIVFQNDKSGILKLSPNKA